MKIELNAENADIYQHKTRLNKIIHWCCSQLDLHVTSVNIIMVDTPTICSIHKDYLNDDSPTDVITFNLGSTKDIEAEIYICEEYARDQAALYSVDFLEEVSRLLIHSMLHLAGYEDIDKNDKDRMKQEEDKFVKIISEKYLN